MREVLRITKALADPSRLRLLAALRLGELCVCQLIAMLELAPSTVSKHLSILHQAELIESRKDGRWVHYYLPPTAVSDFARQIIRHTTEALLKSATIIEDTQRLKSICSTEMEELCRQRTQQPS